MHKYSDKDIQEARIRLWYMGNLTWKLDAVQKQIYDFFNNNQTQITVINISRRVGKSYFLTVLAFEECLKCPNSKVIFLQPEQKQIRINIAPIIDKIISDCPTELRPHFKTQDNKWIFPNGSYIQLAGTDGGNHEKLRGMDSNLCLVDEAGFVSGHLEYIVQSVLSPTTMLTKGKILLSSTTPKEKNHEFNKYVEEAELNGTLYKLTIFQALDIMKEAGDKRLTDDIVNHFIGTYSGGVANENFRRECLCELVVDSTNSVFPEADEDLLVDITHEWPMPAFCNKYVAMDCGFKDLTVVLFAFYDFHNAVLVVQDEIVMNGPEMTTANLAKKILDKEKELWTNKMTGEFEPPKVRVSDNNLILINDLQRLHGLTFLPTRKDEKEMQVNQARMLISEKRVYINPKCKTLISHLKYAVWDRNRKKFARSPDRGHYDAADAFIYLVRNIDKNANPYPRGYERYQNQNGQDLFINPYSDTEKSPYDKLDELFKPKSSLAKFKINK